MSEIKEYSIVCAAFDKHEFEDVYNLLFSTALDRSTSLQKAFDQLKIWNTRLPVDNMELKNTEILLQIMLRDESRLTNASETSNLLRSGYSMTLTKFLNNLCHEKYRNFRTAAAAMGLESFVVDIRNIGHHLENYASIDLYRRVVAYCLDWLKVQFWDKELQSMLNVKVNQLTTNTPHTNTGDLTKLLVVYDNLAEVLEKHGLRSCRMLNTIELLPPHKVKALASYSKSRQDDSLNNLFQGLLVELQFIVLQADVEELVVNLPKIIISHCNYFFTSKGIKYYQPLIRLLIRAQQLEKFCKQLLYICEDQKEPNERRSGALFWVASILDSLNKFKHLKDIQQDDSFTNDRCRSALNAYKENLSVDVDQFLIIGDLYQRPWKLEFRQPYLIKRLDYLSEFTKPIMVKLLKLANPPFLAQELKDVENKLEEYYANTDRRLKRKSITLPTVDGVKTKKKCGAWSYESGVFLSWEKYAIGAQI